MNGNMYLNLLMFISILMSVRNEAKYLRACLDSIREQTHQNWELVVVDDHSSDKTVSILEEYAKKDQRIKWSANKGKGILPALQQAFDLSNGSFITRMDGDDLMPSYKLSVLLDLLVNAPVRTIATGKVRYFSDNEVSDGYRRYEHWLNSRCELNDHWKWVYRECVIASPNWLCRREDMIEIGGFKSQKYPEDYDLVLQWYTNDFRIACTGEITHLWREHTERTSRQSIIYNQGSFFTLKLSYLVKEFSTQDFLVLGTGQKARQCIKQLEYLGRIVFKFNERNDPTNKRHINNLPSNAGILILGTYPDAPERKELENFIFQRGYVFGQNAFYV
jgi:glycosyltransferase involved in cell wall biosynthesis